MTQQFVISCVPRTGVDYNLGTRYLKNASVGLPKFVDTSTKAKKFSNIHALQLVRNFIANYPKFVWTVLEAE